MTNSPGKVSLENCTHFVPGDPSTHPPHYEPLCAIALSRYELHKVIDWEEINPECYVSAMWDSDCNEWLTDDDYHALRRLNEAAAIFWIVIAPKVEAETVAYLKALYPQED